MKEQPKCPVCGIDINVHGMSCIIGGKSELESPAVSAFEKCRYTNGIVNHMLCGGASLEEVIVALCGQQDAMLKRLIEVESYAPKKIKTDDGKVYVWHCPDDLIPLQNI